MRNFTINEDQIRFVMKALNGRREQPSLNGILILSSLPEAKPEAKLDENVAAN